MNIFSQVLAKRISSYNGEITVIKDSILQGNDLHISVQGVTQTGWIIKKIWEKSLDEISQKNKTWLVLGVAGGTLVHMIIKKYAPKFVTGVEIDPQMIEIGQRYFGLNKLENTKIINADATKYIRNKPKVDFLLVDILTGKSFPNSIKQLEFIKDCRKIATTVVFNQLPPANPNALSSEWQEMLHSQFHHVVEKYPLANRLYICS